MPETSLHLTSDGPSALSLVIVVGAALLQLEAMLSSNKQQRR